MLRHARGPLCVVVVGLLLAAGEAGAAERFKLTDASFLEVDGQLKAAEGRPNEEARLAGLKAYLRDDFNNAVSQFERGAYYADKYSQHYLSLMYWHGAGITVDPVQAYIWADLAAERGSRQMLLIREKMWTELTPAQQEQVAARGQAFYARYGDAVAKPRAEGAMRRFADGMTGSRAGYDGQMLATSGKPVSGQFAGRTGSNASAYTQTTVGSREQLYPHANRAIDKYWAEQDRLLEGKTRVGPVTPVRGDNGD